MAYSNGLIHDYGFNAARGFVGGATANDEVYSVGDMFVSMPHAALWVVQHQMAKRFFRKKEVSMPHAALWVVQLRRQVASCQVGQCFNAARGFVGGATVICGAIGTAQICFNAARGFVGGATASLAALVPLGRKSSFGKSPEI